MTDPIQERGIVLPERILVEVLEAGYNMIANNPDRLGDIFTSISPQDLKELQDFVEKNRRMGVFHGYARTDSKFPAWYVTLETEAEIENPVGEFLDETLDQDSDKYICDFGALYQMTYAITTYGLSPNMAQLLYTICKYILIVERGKQESLFACNGFLEIVLSGSDLRPNSEFEPDLVYNRGLNFSMKMWNIVPRIFSKITGVQVQYVYGDESQTGESIITDG